MNTIMLASVLAAGASIGAAAAQNTPNGAPSAPWSIPSDAEIHRILVTRIDTQRQSVGIVVGVVDAKGRRIVSYGQLNQDDARPLNGETVFEIGSITKVFTSLLLSDMARRGEVTLDDPVSKFLPPGVRVPERGGTKITLIDLATHTSGLPRMPTNFLPIDATNPYADYTVDQLYQFLGAYALTRDIGSKYEYSNLGAGLLGHALSLRSGMDYELLVRQRITGPLGMENTAITLSPSMKARLAVGHDAMMKPVKNWDNPTLAGAGALHSTANDLLRLLAAEIGVIRTPLQSAMATQLSVRRPTGSPNYSVALGWHELSDSNATEIEHNGGTGGYRSFVGFDARARVGVVALANAETAVGADDIGRYILIGKPLANPQPPRVHTEIALDTRTKQSFVGQFQLSPNFIIAFTLEGDRLFTRATGQQKIEVFPESPTQVFLRVVDAQVTFVIGADGRASSIILHQNGRDTPGERIRATTP